MAYLSDYPQLNDEAWLREHYVTKRQNLQAIAREVDCHWHAVARALRRFGIEIERRGPGVIYPQLHDREWLARAVKTKSLREIADEIGCAESGVRSALRRLGISVPSIRRRRPSQTRSRSVQKALNARYPEGRHGLRGANWRGGRVKRGDYWFLHRDLVAKRWPDHPRLAMPGWTHKQEHVLVIEADLGRCLTTKERVHHGPGGKEDNRLENLTLVASQGEHVAGHWKDALEALQLRQRVAYLEELLDRNGIPYEESN